MATSEQKITVEFEFPFLNEIEKAASETGIENALIGVKIMIVQRVLDKHCGNVTKAAQALKMNRTTLTYWKRRYGLKSNCGASE